MLIELMMALERSVDVKMLQKDTAGTGIFRQDQVHRLQHVYRAKGHILQVADRCWNEV